jgi:N-acetyl-gamma-glutamyl-phosphate reductase
MRKVAVLGASGYLGGEILRLLSFHPELELAQVISQSQPDRPVADLFPNLHPEPKLRTRAELGPEPIDLAFLAQPPGEAMKLVPTLLERGVKVVDLGPDYRLPTAELYRATYGHEHVDPQHLSEAVYGLTEWHADQIRGARLVANPGCYPTAAVLALAPLLRAHQIQGPIIIDAKSGTSGAGQGLSSATHHPEAALTVAPYGTPHHRHLPEMEQALGALVGAAPPILFVPHLVPVVRGILCSIYPTPAPGADPSRWTEILKRAYAGSPFVHVGGIPRLNWAQGTNHCYLSVQMVGGMPVLFSVLDNLGKGGSAQAIQNANLMLGLPAALGLDFAGFGV